MAISAVLGNVVRIGPILVKDINGVLVDPAAIAVTAQRPDGTTTTPATPTKDSVGTYHLDYEPAVSATMVGAHHYTIATTNPDAAYRDVIYFT